MQTVTIKTCNGSFEFKAPECKLVGSIALYMATQLVYWSTIEYILSAHVLGTLEHKESGAGYIKLDN